MGLYLEVIVAAGMNGLAVGRVGGQERKEDWVVEMGVEGHDGFRVRMWKRLAVRGGEVGPRIPTYHGGGLPLEGDWFPLGLVRGRQQGAVRGRRINRQRCLAGAVRV